MLVPLRWLTNCYSPLRFSSFNVKVSSLGRVSCNISLNCLDESESRRYRQKCDPCLQEANECANNGTCRALSFEKFTCDCLSAYHGERCEKVIDACFDSPCKQRGRCQALPEGRFQCHCSAGYTGYRCETNIDDCISHRCLNNGTCVDQINEYSCQCPPLLTGKSDRLGVKDVERVSARQANTARIDWRGVWRR